MLNDYMFTAKLSPYYKKRVEIICGIRGWTHSDLMIHLLEGYQSPYNQPNPKSTSTLPNEENKNG